MMARLELLYRLLFHQSLRMQPKIENLYLMDQLKLLVILEIRRKNITSCNIQNWEKLSQLFRFDSQQDLLFNATLHYLYTQEFFICINSSVYR
jgi:hypothetical protein